MDLELFLQMMADRQATDLFLCAGAPPALNIDGELQLLEMPALEVDAVAAIADGLMDEAQREAFSSTHEMNLGLSREGLGRFRVNVYRQRGKTGIAFRFVPARIPSIQELHLPATLGELIMQPRGLILVVGGAGCGKSTTLASMIDHRNRHRAGHILSIEDPIEFIHAHHRSLVDQREVGVDTLSFEEAMRNAMRQAPNVILIGEIRDRTTMEQALRYAQTGQLCLATLHANNAAQTLERILGFFPDASRAQVLLDLSQDLKAVVSQRLLRTKSGGRRRPAVELLLQTTFVSDLIRAGEIEKIKDAMKQGIDRGMLTFEESLVRLYDAGVVEWDEAMEHADSRSDLALRRRLAEPLAVESTDDGMIVETTAKQPPERDVKGTWTDGKTHDHRI